MTHGLPGCDAAWHQRLRQAAWQPPQRPRVALWWQQAEIGSVEPDFFDRSGLLAVPQLRDVLRRSERGWHLDAPALTPTLERLARAMHGAGLAGAWRDEQLAVRDAGGRVLGTIERAAVRPLGIATRAVHLVAHTPDGHQWVQQRALDKPNDPGLWDTLMGGMVPAGDTLEAALARETWEEAGLRLDQLQHLRRGGWVETRRPASDGRGAGYMVERIDWWQAVVPAGVVPSNQDGEVAQFQAWPPTTVAAHLLAGDFTLEAALVLADVHGAGAQPARSGPTP